MYVHVVVCTISGWLMGSKVHVSIATCGLACLNCIYFLIMTSQVDVHYQARTTEVFNLNECVIQEIQFLNCTPIAQ